VGVPISCEGGRSSWLRIVFCEGFLVSAVLCVWVLLPQVWLVTMCSFMYLPNQKFGKFTAMFRIDDPKLRLFLVLGRLMCDSEL
jgi:hypothetical protein